ncbi:centrosomin isoform X11 [Drosophila santomea]|uniref:centrosomin isoform X11 n=1 Tax=Drosophila santomea TaxID=129105 RepID=UPI0019532C3F|nr:centrosomin isoform X11 [Drosophila santomea]
MDQSKQVLRDYCGDGNGTCASSLREITLIETVTSFLEENGASEIDRRVLRKLAEALSKSIDDTSPGALQDVTMENSYASFDVARPTGGSHSPLAMQGRSVRELEEQMSTLRKENFNLKLRIYFMEEGQPGARANNSSDSLSKQLIDAKIEIETLRKTVDEKMELLKDAARAISHHEELQRKADFDSQAMIDELQEQIHAYQVAESGQPGENVADAKKLLRLESEVQRLEEELVKSDARNIAAKNELEFTLAERLESLTACEAKIQEQAIKNAELVERLEKETESAESSSKTLDPLKAEIEVCRRENQTLVTSTRSLEHELLRQVGSMKEAANTMDVQRQSILLLEATIKRKEKSYGSMMKNVLKYEALIAKLNAELEIMRQQNVYFRELSENLQQKEVRQLDRGVAIVQPMRMAADAGRFVWQSGTIIAQEPLPLERQSAAATNVSVSPVYLSSGASPDQTYPFPADGHDGSKYGLLQLFAAKLHWIPAVPLALGHVALKIILLVVRVHSCLQNTHIPLKAKRDLGAQLADKICELQDAQEKLKERERIHEQACRTIQKLMQKLSSQEKEIKKLNQENEQSANKENDCAKTVISPSTSGRSMSDNEASSLEMSTNLRVRYELKIGEQEEKIKQLQTEVKKKTANLQNLVNKELWEKNREVERLTKLVASQQKTLPQISEESAGEADLQQSFTEAEYMRALERNKLLQRKVDVLFQRLADDQQNSAVIGQLRLELQQARTEVETADKWRLECVDVCGVLTNRLEELAGFLNSLLKHKDVLGVLAADRRNAMRKAVDRSLDLSKSLNMTLNITATSLADQSLAQLCNLSEILYTEGDASHKTFNSHEELHAASSMAPTVENLKAENKALKKELEKRRSSEGQRKERRSLPLPSQQLDNQSESEAWSEPDRKVSLARIGLDETSNSLAAPEQAVSESESEGRTCATRQDRNRNSERIAQLEEQIAQKDERMLSVQCQMVDLDNRYKQEQLRFLDISQKLEQLRVINEALTADLQTIGSHEDQRMVELQRQLELKNQQIDQLKLAQSTLTADSQITEMELQALQQQMQEMEQQHADSVDTLQSQLTQLKLDAAQQLEEHERLHQDALERDWVALTTYQEQAQQLLELQRSLDYHQENEKELKQTLVENELATRALKKQLDESTLQASKAVMERTKAYNDKLQLEKRSEELRLQLEALKEEQQKLLQKRSNSSDVSQSGYTSEEVAVPMGPPSGQVTTSKQAGSAVVGQRVNTSSPDLGIESDAGRVSNVELSNAQRAMLKTVELKTEGATSSKTKSEESASPDSKSNLAAGAATVHDCAKVDLENAELRRKLIRTKRAFEDTYEKLRMANKAKAQVEKDIKNQILKTHNVLRNVRSNMENEL